MSAGSQAAALGQPLVREVGEVAADALWMTFGAMSLSSFLFLFVG
jgi:hypothetical protein